MLQAPSADGKAVQMVSDNPKRDMSLELGSLQAQSGASESRFYDAAPQLPAFDSTPDQQDDNPAAAVLEHIYRDMISALQQMYRDTIAAKDDALAGRDRELETKDALIEHLRRRAEEAEARASQALRYIGELDQIAAHARSHAEGTKPPAKTGVIARFLGK
jgi:hypothetical protein